MDKAPDAFRTISEVAEALETPAHVLRFWESRFPQIKPVKRAGGRRYYRPADVALLGGIRHLLHSEGMTIRGVQKVLREQGVRHVAALGGGDINEMDMEAVGDLAEEIGADKAVVPEPKAHVLPLEGLSRNAFDLASGPAPAPTAQIQSLFATVPEAAAPPPPARQSAETPPDIVLPRAGDGGFIAFSNPRRPRPKSLTPDVDDLLQPRLPLEPEPADAAPETMLTEAPLTEALLPETQAPEGQHIWAEPAPDAVPVVLPLAKLATPALPSEVHFSPAPEAIGPDPALDAPPSPDATVVELPQLAGLAARLRALSNAPEGSAFQEMHARLGLLHAQMAEALRLRR